MSSPITLEIEHKVATITLNRPDVLNAINEAMLPPWVDALEECRLNSDVAVIVVTGAGEAFLSGGVIPPSWARIQCHRPWKSRSSFGIACTAYPGSLQRSTSRLSLL